VNAGRLVVLLVPGVLTLGGCTTSVEGEATAAPGTATPESSEQLEALIVPDVPSGLPLLPDDELEPPAGPKTVEDVAAYADDPDRERQVLEDYGYRFGWERFWGRGTGPVTGVFVDQFANRAGAGAYAEDLARNDVEHYGGMLRETPEDLPSTCRSMTIDDPGPDLDLGGPAAFAWCAHGVFSVAVTVVADSVDAAEAEMTAVVAAQLNRLPPS
jgi:hypothetical protein